MLFVVKIIFLCLILIFKPVSFLLNFVLNYYNEYKTKKSKNETGLKIFKPRKNLNYNI